jgi:hypothetical protein
LLNGIIIEEVCPKLSYECLEERQIFPYGFCDRKREQQGLSLRQRWWGGYADGMKVGTSTLSVGHRDSSEPGEVFILDQLP